ncbi:MAG TPA: hypothetical protein VF573_14475 [Paraburkholderia sp.]|uniref:hypothetical protein n=1 Tax=Paraburkholderia sp. TaxID=1926495 RepID=UPI002ED5E902
MNHVVGYLNVIGLIAGFIGGVVTFFYGLPNIDILNSGGYVKMEETDSIRRYKLISKIGVGLIAVGFLMQLPSAIFSINQ